jgi:hypothetical protein
VKRCQARSDLSNDKIVEQRLISEKILAIEADVEFGGELLSAEGTTGEEAVADLESRDFAAAVVDAEDEIFGVGIVFDIDFADLDAAILEERFGATAVGAPGGAVHDDGGSGCVSHLC